MTFNERGAEIQARNVKPSIDLATLIQLLAKAILLPDRTDLSASKNPRQRSAFLFDPEKQRLKLCASGVLRRLFGQPEFRTAFDPAQNGGFVRDCSNPAFGVRSRLGGHLTEGNAEKLTGAVDELIQAIDQAIDLALLPNVALNSLLLDQPEQHLRQLARNAQTVFQPQASSATLMPVAFKAEGSVTQEDQAVAKVISALERIRATDYFDQLCSAVSDYLLHQRDLDEDDVDSAIDSLAAEQARVDSQITRFLNFLDDEALSRVRLTIAFQIMETIAGNARTVNKPGHQLLVEYVRRASSLLEATKETGYRVDLTAHYGSVAEFELLDYLNRATFYSCLAVWPEWKTQIFEEKSRNHEGTSYEVVRDVSYRFRVNGRIPEKNKVAFEGRLDDLASELNDWQEQARSQPGRFCRRLAELVFLAVVIPCEDSSPEEDVAQTMQELLSLLRTGGPEAVNALIEDLRGRAPVLKSIAGALIEVLRTKSQAILSQVQQHSSQQFICVKRSIIEWSRLEGAEPGVRDLLVGAAQQSREPMEWFQHIEIASAPVVPNLLFSVRVTTEISEYSLVVSGETSALQAQRLLPPQLLQICWVPYHASKDGEEWKYTHSEDAPAAKDWVLPASIHVEYEIETLQRRSGNQQADKSKQFHAAAIAAFTVLVYCCLWRITHRLKQLDPSPEFTTLMLRLQDQGKPVEEGHGDSYVYAAAQAIEAMLGQDLDIRMQGIVLDNLVQKTSSAKYVKSGVFNALLSAFPIAISTPSIPAVSKIGLISYSVRPCDDQPMLSPDEKGYLLLAQSYVATAIEQPFSGYQLQVARRQADVIDRPDQLKRQRLIQEEISYLKAQGCQHIMLLSHSYGSRHLNRAADYNSLLTPKEFLNEISESFPDLTIYTLLRDVFPATRMQRRDPKYAALEILRTGNHSTFLQAVDTVKVRKIIPVYTFATLYVVEEEKLPQSGFCIYFLVSDQRVANFDWTERARQHLVNADQQSAIHPCLIAVLRGLHFLEAERGVLKGQLTPVLDPFNWISPNTIEAAGEVEIMHNRRKGKVLLNYPALLCHVSRVLHRSHRSK